MVFFIEENWQLLKAYLQGVRVLRRLPREMVDPAFLQQRLQRLAPAPQEKPDDRQASSHPRNPQTGGQSGGGALGGRRRASTASAAAADARNGSQPQRGAPALEIRCDGAVIREYESVLAGARRAVKARGGTGAAFPATLTLFFAVRLLAVAAAATGSPAAALLLCAAQFAVAPYSLFVSLTALLALAPVLFCGHYAVWFALRAALRAALPRAWAAAHLEVTHTFIAVFFAVDQLLCALCVYATPRGRSAPVSARRLLQSVVFGFLNTKTYWLVLLFCMRAWVRRAAQACPVRVPPVAASSRQVAQGVRLEVVVLGVDYALGASRRVGALIARHTMHWAPLFYHQHRMAHLPHVYEHAHKFHHYLHGARPLRLRRIPQQRPDLTPPCRHDRVRRPHLWQRRSRGVFHAPS